MSSLPATSAAPIKPAQTHYSHLQGRITLERFSTPFTSSTSSPIKPSSRPAAQSRPPPMTGTHCYHPAARRHRRRTGADPLQGPRSRGTPLLGVQRPTRGRTDVPQRLLAAASAFRNWGLRNRDELALLYGSPIAGYAAPAGGPPRRRGAASPRCSPRFSSTSPPRDGCAPYLAVSSNPDSSPTWRATSAARSLTPAHVYAFLVGWQRLLGLVTTEAFGHLAWAFPNADAFIRAELQRLVDELVLTP